MILPGMKLGICILTTTKPPGHFLNSLKRGLTGLGHRKMTEQAQALRGWVHVEAAGRGRGFKTPRITRYTPTLEVLNSAAN